MRSNEIRRQKTKLQTSSRLKTGFFGELCFGCCSLEPLTPSPSSLPSSPCHDLLSLSLFSDTYFAHETGRSCDENASAIVELGDFGSLALLLL